MTKFKDEIDTCLAANLDLSKWKLAVLATLTAAGLGVLKDVNNFDYGYLLLFMAPYVCAYIDLLLYEREARIHQIAKYLRHYQGPDLETAELHRYESYINDRRTEAKRTWLPHEHIAQISSSVVSSICIPLLAILVEPYKKAIGQHSGLIWIPAVGVVLVLGLYAVAKWNVNALSKHDKELPPANGGTGAATSPAQLPLSTDALD